MNYDAIVIGGGLAGSTLARQLAQSGHKVIVLDREIQFRDRVRGENMLPWGVAAAQRLGVLDELIKAGAHQPPCWTTYIAGQPGPPRNFAQTTPFVDGQLNMFHPELQETLLQSAIHNGVEVMRGAVVTGIQQGTNPSVTFEFAGKQQTYNSQIIVGADGRGSEVRQWAGFSTERNPDLLTIAGVLIQKINVPEESVHLFFGNGMASLVAPLGQKRARVYFVYPGVAARRGLSGNRKVTEFLNLCQAAGVPSSWLDDAEPAGPLAEFNGADRWAPSPASNGVVLIGDAAAASDPSWGSGLSLTLLDVEHLANALCSNQDWNAAAELYAKEHDEYYGALHRILGWMTELFWSYGPEADARRAKVLARMTSDPRGFPDSMGLGPFGPNDEQARRLMLGLDY